MKTEGAEELLTSVETVLKPLLNKRVSDLQWGIVHGALAVNIHPSAKIQRKCFTAFHTVKDRALGSKTQTVVCSKRAFIIGAG